MGGLGDVGGVDVVVVRHVVTVVVLQGHQVGDEGVQRDFEHVQQVSLLQSDDDNKSMFTVNAAKS